MSSLEEAILDWMESPINDHGTPYVPHPEDFTRDEQKEFLDLIREDRFVSRDEQIQKLRDIIARRKPVVNEGVGRPRIDLRVQPTKMWTSRSKKVW